MDSTTLSLIRKYCNDTIEPYQFSDEEIESIYVLQDNNVYYTVAEIWLQKAISTKGAKEVKSYSIGNESYSFDKSLYDEYMELYELFLSKGNMSGAIIFERTANTEEGDEYDFETLTGEAYDSEFN